MKSGDTQVGTPAIQYTNTQASIEALTGIAEGATAYATDINKFGSYDGSTWTWGGGSGVARSGSTTGDHIAVWNGSDVDSIKDGGATPAGGSIATDPIWDAKGDLAVGTGADTAAKLTVGANGKYLKAASGEVTGLIWDTPAGSGDVVGPAGATDGHLAIFDGATGKLIKDGGAIPSKGISYTDKHLYTGTQITMNSTSFANLDTGLDCTVTAQSGDVIMVGFAGEIANANVDTYFDACTIVSGSPVNYVSNGSGTPPTDGVTAWYAAPAHYIGIGGTVIYALVAGDISSGTVKVRIRYRTYSATARIMYAGTAAPIIFWVVNLSR